MKLPLGASWIGVATYLGAIAVGCLLGAILLGRHVDGSWPAWVQAIGSVAAIFTAVLVPNRIAAREREGRETQRKFRSKTYAFVLLPIVKSLKSNLLTAQHRWKRMPSDYDDDAVAEYMNLPSGLTDRMLDLHELGESGVAIQNAIFAVNAAKEGVQYEYTYMRYGGMYYDPGTGDEEELPDPDEVGVLFGSALAKADEAIAALSSVLEE